MSTGFYIYVLIINFLFLDTENIEIRTWQEVQLIHQFGKFIADALYIYHAYVAYCLNHVDKEAVHITVWCDQ